MSALPRLARMSWDRRTPKQQQADLARALKAQVVHAVGPFSPYWKARFAALGTTATAAATPAGLAALPAVGERDVCPEGDGAAAAALVLQSGEAGWAVHTDGPQLRRALVNRVLRPASYRAVVEADTRTTSFVEAGLGVRFPVASTRSDLDVVARAGARLWRVLGLKRADVVVAAVPLTRTASLQALELGALAAGTPAMFPGDDVDDVARGLGLLPATVLVLLPGDAARMVDDLDEAGGHLADVRTVLLLGAPSDDERAETAEALVRAGLNPTVLAAHAPEGHRLLWGECRPGAGLHSYPDLDVVHLVDPETGAPAEQGEVVVTQLGMRGSALLRWRTGDLAEGLDAGRCPSCHRSVTRVMGLERGALVPTLALRTGTRAVDLRGVTAALEGRADVVDWRVLVGPSARDGADEVLVHVLPHHDEDPSDLAVGIARDVRAAAGLLPSQVVVDDVLPVGSQLTHRVLLRSPR
jgi:phenylacetate-CoA ligase